MFVFVYGTLKRGYGNNIVLGDSEFVGDAVTLTKFHVRCCGFPVVFKQPEDAFVTGEVYNVRSKHVLAALDRLEGVPHMYTRETVVVRVPALKQDLDAHIYVGAGRWGDRRQLLEVPRDGDDNYKWEGAVRTHNQRPAVARAHDYFKGEQHDCV